VEHVGLGKGVASSDGAGAVASQEDAGRRAAGEPRRIVTSAKRAGAEVEARDGASVHVVLHEVAIRCRSGHNWSWGGNRVLSAVLDVEKRLSGKPFVAKVERNVLVANTV